MKGRRKILREIKIQAEKKLKTPLQKKEKKQTTIHKTQHRNLKTVQHKLRHKLEVITFITEW